MASDSTHRERFIIEAREHLAVMTAALIALERREGDARGCIERLLRSSHSIKGGAAFTGRAKVEQLAHRMETALENLRDGHVPTNAEAVDILLAVLDRITAMIDDLDHSDETDIAEPLSRLGPLIDPAVQRDADASDSTAVQPQRLLPTAPDASTAQPGEFPLSERVRAARQEGGAFLYGVKLDWYACERQFSLSPLDVAQHLENAGNLLDSRLDLAGPALSDGVPDPPLWYRAILSSALEPEQFAQRLAIPCAAIVRLENVAGAPPARERTTAESPARPPAGAASLRISVALIDRMMGLAGELALVRNQALRSTDPANAPLRRLVRRLDSVTSDLQDAALRMRMQPVGTLFDRFPRLVRDLARQLGKQIDIQITGSEVELDKTILELLADPLTHLVRNCCDHGVELPDVRTRSKKPPTGTIRLIARQERGQIVIEVRDDGRGIDPDAIRRKALEQGIKRQDEIQRLNERQLYELILLSGFSTAARVTDLSGRGVGMDVVKTNLEQIGGVVEIDSSVGRGTIFMLRLPLTLAIMPCLLLGSGGQRYAVPQRDLEEIVLLGTEGRRLRIECSQDEEVLRLRGALVPVVRLEEVLGSRQPFTPETRQQIIRRYHRAQPMDGRMYVVVLRVGSHRFGLVVDEVLESEEIVVKPLHPLLRPLTVFSGSTILGDGAVGLILSGEGIARHSGVMHRPPVQEMPALAAPEPAGLRGLLLFRYGPAELLAAPLGEVRRLVMIPRERIERVGDRELVSVDGTAINVLRLDQLLNLSMCPERGRLFLILPRQAGPPVGLLASEILDTPTLRVQLDEQAYRVDGVLGSMMIGGQIAVLLDVGRLLEMWGQIHHARTIASSGGPRKRILVVEDTQFFQRLITSHLQEEGYEVELAGNGSEGLTKLAAGSFDLIVSDLEMPVMDGLTFALRVRQEPRHSTVPLLALTTLSSAEHRGRAFESGFDAYEVKLDRHSFLTAVKGLLSSGRSLAIAREAANE